MDPTPQTARGQSLRGPGALAVRCRRKAPGPLSASGQSPQNAGRPNRFLALSGLPQQLRQLGDIRRDPPRVQTHLRIHKPVVVTPAEHLAPSGTPSEQTTETSTSLSLQLTVPWPLTIRRPWSPFGPG